MKEVILEYKRLGDLSTGRIVVRANSVEVSSHEFDAMAFEPMLYNFADAIQENADAAAVIQRTDREGLVPYRLDATTVDLFRIDPIAAVRSMSTPYGSPSNSIKRTKQERTPITHDIRVGHSTLADAFGEELYTRFDLARGRAECPCCGIWGSLAAHDKTGTFFIKCKKPSCAIYEKAFPVSRRNGRWVSFLTFDLLQTKSPKFFLPRDWNNGQIWISWDDLNAKYNQFHKEKKACP